MTYLIANELIEDAQKGELNACDLLAEALQKPVRGVIRKILPRWMHGDVDDLAQEVFAKIFKNLTRYDPHRNVLFSTWVYALVRNHCLDTLKRSRLPMISVSGPDESMDLSLEHPGRSPLVEAQRKEFDIALKKAVDSLPEDLDIIFRLRELEGLEFKRIAQTLNIPLGTVKTRHYRAVDRLRACLRSFRLAV